VTAPASFSVAMRSQPRPSSSTSDIAISEREHGPAGARRYRYIPTFIMRGLTQLHLEFR
jgi:hypothetical protein